MSAKKLDIKSKLEINDEIDGERIKCKICGYSRRTLILIPCGHISACWHCQPKVEMCSNCQVEIHMYYVYSPPTRTIETVYADPIRHIHWNIEEHNASRINQEVAEIPDLDQGKTDKSVAK